MNIQQRIQLKTLVLEQGKNNFKERGTHPALGMDSILKSDNFIDFDKFHLRFQNKKDYFMHHIINYQLTIHIVDVLCPVKSGIHFICLLNWHLKINHY